MELTSAKLRERLSLSERAPEPGDRVFAKSSDGKFYVADVLASEAGGVRVEFLRGGELVVAPDELKRCTFLPGDRVSADWPWWGPYTCTVVSYDEHYETVTLSDGWSEESFEVDKVWIEPPKSRDEAKRSRLRVYALIAAGGAVVGGTIGSLLTAFFLR